MKKPNEELFANSPEQIKRIVENAENHIYVKYRNGIIKMSKREYELYLGANRQTRNKMLKLSKKGIDLTKHFKPL